MQAHTPFTRDSALTQLYFSSHPTSCKLTHRLPETVPSLNYISHLAQHHASSHTVYQRQYLHSVIFLITLNFMQAHTPFTRQCLHSIIFLISPNIMQAHTPFTRDSALTQLYFSSRPTSCKLTHRLPETVPSLNYISHLA